MNFKTFVAALAFTAVAITVHQAFAQASVVTGQTTYIYVDANSGSDSNPGTESRPLKTIGVAISHAMTNNRSGVGSTIMINPGVYREMIRLAPTYGQTSANITFQAVTPGTAIVDAADVLTGWAASGGGEYTHSWKSAAPSCPAPSDWPSEARGIVLLTDMVFVNGAPLTQVETAAQMRAGTFFANEQYQQLHIWPPTGTDMNTAVVEVANRQKTLSIYQWGNLVFRGLVFEHAASCVGQNGANISQSTNVLVDNVQANWNNWGGFGVNSSSYVTVQNSTAKYNGGVGFTAMQSTNLLYQNDETDYNNWRGAMGAFYDWAMGGAKLMGLHGSQLLHHTAYGNQAEGLWYDTGNSNITVSNGIFVDNLLSNVLFEANQGPISLQNSSLCLGGLGLSINNSANLTITGNNLYANGTVLGHSQFLVDGPNGRTFTNWQTKQSTTVYTSNTEFNYNSIVDSAPSGQIQFLFNSFLTVSSWNTFVDGYHGAGNDWYDANQATAFMTQGGKRENLSGWQNLTGQDLSSNWKLAGNATTNCSVPQPSYPDFQVNADNSSYSMPNGVATINLQLKSFNFAPATLSVEGLPNGVSSSFSSSTLATGNSVLTLKASPSAPTESVPVTIFAASGSRVHTITVLVNIAP